MPRKWVSRLWSWSYSVMFLRYLSENNLGHIKRQNDSEVTLFDDKKSQKWVDGNGRLKLSEPLGSPWWVRILNAWLPPWEKCLLLITLRQKMVFRWKFQHRLHFHPNVTLSLGATGPSWYGLLPISTATYLQQVTWSRCTQLGLSSHVSFYISAVLIGISLWNSRMTESPYIPGDTSPHKAVVISLGSSPMVACMHHAHRVVVLDSQLQCAVRGASLAWSVDSSFMISSHFAPKRSLVLI